MRTPFLALACACMASGGTGLAAVINIDFNGPLGVTHSGLAAAPDASGGGALWNALTRSGWQDEIQGYNLLDSAGNQTSVAISLGINGVFDSTDGHQEHGMAADLMNDYAFLSAEALGIVTTQTGLISGLIPGASYEVYFYSQGNRFTGGGFKGQNGLFSAGGLQKQTGWDGIQGGDGALTENVEYVKFGVTADAEGKVDFTWSNVVAGAGGNVDVDSDGHNSIYSALNGIQIVSMETITVPEPATSLLALLGAAALFRRRR